MKNLILALVFVAAAGCEKPPPPPQGHLCDYCKVEKPSAKAYSCRQCGKVHWSCKAEAPLHAMEYSKGSKEKENGGAVGYAIKKCPE